MELSNQL